MVRVREHAEAIAFLDGEPLESKIGKELFRSVMRTLYLKLGVIVPLATLLVLSSAGSQLFPYAILEERYFNGQVSFGSVTVAASVFATLTGSFTTLVTMLPQVASVGAQAVRVHELWLDICGDSSDSSGPEYLPDKGIQFTEISMTDRVQSKTFMRLTDVTIRPLPHEPPLVTGLTLDLHKEEALMIAGPSGVGKSSIFRVLGHLWKQGDGTVAICSRQEILFLPQEPYLCLGSIADNATYPSPPPEESEKLAAALESLHLGHLMERFGLREPVDLSTVLSQGEKQRLVFTRLLMRDRVRLALLDEATSAQDVENEDNLYRILQGAVDTFISVAHKPNLEKFHTHKLILEKKPAGGCSWSVRQILPPPAKACAMGCAAGSRAAVQQLFAS
eukprot:1289365-Amphidinium_carterae.1